jgi:hypothetical protein
MKQAVKIGQTDYTILVLIRDTAGAPKTALTYGSSGIDVCYTRVETDNDVVLTAGAPAETTLTGAHVDWGFVKVDDTNAPGLYKLDIADGVFASGAWSAVVSLICTGCDPVHVEFMLVPESPSLGVTGGGFVAGAITATAMAADCITEAKIADNAIAAEHLAAAAIDFATFAADCKTGTGLKANVESISANAITATAINADAITSAKIADDAISSEHLNTGAITADAFAANAIVAATLNTGVITNAKFAAGAIDAAAIAAGAIDAATFAADVDAEAAAWIWNAATASFGGAGTYGQAVEDILVDTATTLQGELDGIQADTEDIQARLPAALITGRMNSNVAAVNDVAVDGTGTLIDPWGPV